MKRRDFLKYTTGAVAIPALLGGFGINTLAASPFVAAAADLANETDRILVLIYLYGGNDGLNTLIPLDKYDQLANVRSSVIVPQNSVLPLSGVSTVGLHPAMTGLQQLYNNGKVKIVQSVGYPNPSFSHFRATDIWLSAANTDQYINTGWLGRFLEQEYAGYPTNYPNIDMPDPLAIEISSSQSLVFQGGIAPTSMAISDPTWFYNLVNNNPEPAPNTQWGEQLAYLRLVSQQSNQYGEVVTNAYNNSSNMATYPENNSLADQLKIVARLIAGGLKTRVYMVGLDGFDTHANQVEGYDHTIGNHANLLQKLSQGISSFMADLEQMGVDDRVVGMTVSEFGRRIISNASNGTDHGTSAPQFIFGTPVAGGVLGVTPNIPLTVNEDDNIPHQFDFRSIYATMLRDWLCTPQTQADNVLMQTFATLPLLNVPCQSCALPTPTVSGSANACSNGSFIYNANSPTTGGTFNWTVTGGTILSGQGTNQINVLWDAGTQGTVEVMQTVN